MMCQLGLEEEDIQHEVGALTIQELDPLIQDLQDDTLFMMRHLPQHVADGIDDKVNMVVEDG